MLKKILITGLLPVFFAGIVAAQTGEKKRWPSSERYSFIAECINSAKPALSQDTARFYCYCMLEKVEGKYPDIAEASKITDDELAKPEWQKEIVECLSGTWTSEGREAFLSNCVRVATENVGEKKAQTYCECMLYKIERMYPSEEDAAKITEEDLTSEFWKKMVKDCMEF
ncbi:MAG TPA: hypothetical protein PKC72_15355 [Chitinophagaceae bacterium]|mgnify:CR=1 FL=1|nr:hypothetical protein [Chitinophagaceae bacterium]